MARRTEKAIPAPLDYQRLSEPSEGVIAAAKAAGEADTALRVLTERLDRENRTVARAKSRLAVAESSGGDVASARVELEAAKRERDELSEEHSSLKAAAKVANERLAAARAADREAKQAYAKQRLPGLVAVYNERAAGFGNACSELDRAIQMCRALNPHFGFVAAAPLPTVPVVYTSTDEAAKVPAALRFHYSPSLSLKTTTAWRGFI